VYAENLTPGKQLAQAGEALNAAVPTSLVRVVSCDMHPECEPVLGYSPTNASETQNPEAQTR
jgi:hypothetical protein